MCVAWSPKTAAICLGFKIGVFKLVHIEIDIIFRKKKKIYEVKSKRMEFIKHNSYGIQRSPLFTKSQ